MRSNQLEDRIVVEGGGLPVVWRVAGLAQRAFTAGVPVVFLMATHASGGRIFEMAGGWVTFFAGDPGVTAAEGKTRHRMLKLRFLPAFLVMTGFTGGAQFFSVRIIFEMAGSALGG